MKISIVASGTQGDVRPYVALGRGLKLSGYDVRVLTSDDFAKMVTDAQLEFCSTGVSVEAMLQSEEWRSVVESGNFLRILSRMQKEMKRRAQDLAKTIPALMEGSDWIITGLGGLGGTFSIAQQMGIPFIQAYVFPISPTRAFASPLTPSLPFGSVLNKLSFRMMRQMIWQSTRVADVHTRRELKMPKASWWGPFRSLEERPVLYGYSPHVIPRPDDWNTRPVVTGYWFLNAASDWTPPDDLVEFLKAGTPPVYIGFGSMSNRKPEEVSELALRALALSGQRGVLASGWGGLSPADLPPSVHMIASAPHTWLFPQMSAVVHHGGAGTTAAGFQSGVPSIIIPFMGDQAFWGQRAAQLGVGPAPIPRRRLTAEKLAEAIRQAVTDPLMLQRAAELGAKIRSEDGVGQAVAQIQSIMKMGSL